MSFIFHTIKARLMATQIIAMSDELRTNFDAVVLKAWMTVAAQKGCVSIGFQIWL
jgi:hypothetical protein